MISADNPNSNSRVRRETVENAVSALLKWKDSKTKSEKAQLLPQDDFLYLIVTLNKIPPKGRVNPYKIPLPHSLLQDSFSSELCLIIDDRPKSNLTSDAAKKKVKSEDIPVSKVLKFSKLKTDYKPFEAKRKLCDSYDMFFADKRIIPLLPKLLGKQFFKKNKLPLSMNLSHKNWKEQIERACGSALLYMRAGTCSVVKVGKVSMGSEEIAENVIKAIEGIVEYVPKKWDGLRSLHLKFSESVALPVYQSVPDMKLKIQGISENVEGVEEGVSKVEVEEEKLKLKKLDKKKDKKKGRIHEVRYMDASVIDELGSDDDGDENEKENTEVGTDKGRDEADYENAGEPSESDDVGIDEVEIKKKKAQSDCDGGKPAKKMRMKGESEKQKKSHSAVKSMEESGGKKGKRKSGLGTTEKNSTTVRKVKKSKKQQSAV